VQSMRSEAPPGPQPSPRPAGLFEGRESPFDQEQARFRGWPLNARGHAPWHEVAAVIEEM